MNDAAQLNLVILYDATHNRYQVLDHNLTQAQATEAMERHGNSELRALTVDQRRRHAANDPQNCRACRNEVKGKSGLVPTPKFKRRK